ncbi:unnamed protein product [Effrenium voratum]|nr:unnamed protein product [Effrenium voratum]
MEDGGFTVSPPAEPNPKRPTPKPLDDMSRAVAAEVERQMSSKPVDEAQVARLVKKHLAALDSRPSTARVTSSRQASRGAQDKSAWVSTEFASLSLNAENLEDTLTQRVFAEQPSRRGLGIDEAVVRDVVNTTVRDIVGIFEALLDRLLWEKKSDSIRQMVVELMTEDLSQTLAAGQDRLKEQEIGHVLDEMSRIRQEIRESEQSWEQRFQQVQQLEDALSDFRTSTEQRSQKAEEGLQSVQERYLRKEAFEKIIKEVTADTKKSSDSINEIKAQHEETQNQIKAMEATVSSKLVTKKELQEATRKAVQELQQADEKLSSSLQELQSKVAWQKDLEDLDSQRRKQIQVAQADIARAHDGIKSLGQKVDQNDQRCQEVFAKAVDVEKNFSKFGELLEDVEGRIKENLRVLEKQKSDRRELQEEMSNASSRMDELKMTDENISNGLKELAAVVTDLQTSTSDMATRAYAQEVAKKYADEVVRASTEREEIDALRRDLSEEQERIRANVRQQQSNRKDLNGAIEELNDLRAKAVKVEKSCASLEDKVAEVKGKEAEHWQSMQHSMNNQAQTHEELHSMCQMLRKEIKENAERQEKEGESLRDQSTRRYLEQLDKALELHNGLNKLELSHKDLDHTVRNTRLPAIAS